MAEWLRLRLELRQDDKVVNRLSAFDVALWP